MEDKYGYLTGVTATQARVRHPIPPLWALPMPELPARPDASRASGPLESNSALYLSIIFAENFRTWHRCHPHFLAAAAAAAAGALRLPAAGNLRSRLPQ
jgi:hypothetical protein